MFRTRLAIVVLLSVFMFVVCDDDPVVPPGGGPGSVPDSVSTFLDIVSKVSFSGENGLLGLAFHPDYETNGYFYLNYTSGNHSFVSRWTVSDSDSNKANRSSEKILLQITQPFANHNGGALAFGNDGYLYVSLGDGGSAGDPSGNGQNRTTLLGSILRLDVDQNMDTAPYYGIPADNPFAGNAEGFREEIFAYGLRNVWRMSIDPQTGWLLAGDVGQGIREEIDHIEGGGNYGWDCREGLISYTGPPDSPSSACATATGMIDPIWDYSHSSGNASVSGGYIYRGTALTSVMGDYVFADYVSGRIWAFSYDGSTASNHRQLIDTSAFISAFGVGEDSNLYVVAHSFSGATKIYELVETETSPNVFTFALESPWPTASFIAPVDLQNAGDGSGRIFVVEQPGRILVFDGARN